MEKIRGWVSIIFAGIVLGFLIGFFTLNHIDENIIVQYLIGTSVLGGIFGLVLTIIINKKYPIEDWYQPINRSKDLDGLFEKNENTIPNRKLIDSFPSFSDDDLIIALRFRYHKLTDETSNKLIEELKRRNITNRQIKRLFDGYEFYKYASNNQCPCCGNSKFIIKKGDKITDCMVCGFDIEYDNPKLLINRIRWSLGIHSVSRISLDEMKRFIIK